MLARESQKSPFSGDNTPKNHDFVPPPFVKSQFNLIIIGYIFNLEFRAYLRNFYGETMSGIAGESFESFFLNQWLLLHKRYVDQLISASSSSFENDEQKRLVDDVLSHYKRYYDEKSAAARDDVFVFFSPPWLGCYEKVLLWVGGFKPSMAFRLVKGSVNDLTVEQAVRMERVEAETRAEEREVAVLMETLQESVADPPLGKLAGQYGKLVDGKESEMEESFEILRTGMTAVLEAADELRCYTVGKVVEILSPAQAVRFLAAAGKLQVKLRDLGLQREE